MARTASNPVAPTNSLAQKARPKFSVAIQSEAYKNLINNTLNDPKRASRFIANITSAVSVNPALQECDPATILSAGLLGEALNLTPSPNLGHFYMVPFDDKKRGCKVASFILGYRGYLQLAIRSGQYRRINVLALKEGELVKWDPMTEEIEVNLIEDDEVRENTTLRSSISMAFVSRSIGATQRRLTTQINTPRLSTRKHTKTSKLARFLRAKCGSTVRSTTKTSMP